MVAQHGPVLRGFFVRRGASEDAEDMVQETCRCMPGGSGRIVFRDEPLANVAEDFN